MSRGFGRVERSILEALSKCPSHHVTLLNLACLVQGLITDINEPFPRHQRPSRACRVSVARAVRSLERKGLITGVEIGRQGIMGRSKELWLRTVDTNRFDPILRRVIAEESRRISVAN